MTTADTIATLGVSILLVAFLLQTLKWIKAESVWYSVLNIVGAALAGYSSWMIGFFPFVVLESAWVLASFFSLFKNLKTKSST